MLRAMPNPHFNPHSSWVHQGIARNKERSHWRQKARYHRGFWYPGRLLEISTWRKGWDSNPRGPLRALAVFKTAALNHSATLPALSIRARIGAFKRGGDLSATDDKSADAAIKKAIWTPSTTQTPAEAWPRFRQRVWFGSVVLG